MVPVAWQFSPDDCQETLCVSPSLAGYNANIIYQSSYTSRHHMCRILMIGKNRCCQEKIQSFVSTMHIDNEESSSYKVYEILQAHKE
eukprot:13678797-Ditylum_brightwellii.AAC.1